MAVLPHRSLAIARRTCGSGTGLRGVTPGAASWSRGTRRCGDEGNLTLMQGYVPFDFMGASGEQVFEKMSGYTEVSALASAHVVARAWSDLGVVAAPAAILADDIGDVPVLLVPIPDGQTGDDMANTVNADVNTPVVGRFAETEDAAHSAEFGVSTYLLDQSAPIGSFDLQSVCITRKVPLYIDCPGIGGYWEDGVTTPTNVWCFGGVDHVAEGVNLFKRLEPDQYHLDYQATQRVSDSANLALFPSGAALASGDYVATTATLYSNNPAVGTVAGLDDTACP